MMQWSFSCHAEWYGVAVSRWYVQCTAEYLSDLLDALIEL